MLNHLNPNPTKPSRVVIIGSSGFIGSAISNQLTAQGLPVLGLTRREVNLLGGDAVKTCKGFLKPGDSVVMVSAIAPAKTIPMLMENLRMAEVVAEVLSQTEAQDQSN